MMKAALGYSLLIVCLLSSCGMRKSPTDREDPGQKPAALDPDVGAVDQQGQESSIKLRRTRAPGQTYTLIEATSTNDLSTPQYSPTPTPIGVGTLTSTPKPYIPGGTLTPTPTPWQPGPTGTPTPTPTPWHRGPTNTPTPTPTPWERGPTHTPTPTLPSPTPSCETHTATVTIDSDVQRLQVGDEVTITVVLSNEGCADMGMPKYYLSVSTDSTSPVLYPINPEPIVRYIGISPGESNSQDFILDAVGTGTASLSATVTFEVHLGYPGPAYWDSEVTEKPLMIFVEY